MEPRSPFESWSQIRGKAAGARYVALPADCAHAEVGTPPVASPLAAEPSTRRPVVGRKRTTTAEEVRGSARGGLW